MMIKYCKVIFFFCSIFFVVGCTKTDSIEILDDGIVYNNKTIPLMAGLQDYISAFGPYDRYENGIYCWDQLGIEAHGAAQSKQYANGTNPTITQFRVIWSKRQKQTVKNVSKFDLYIEGQDIFHKRNSRKIEKEERIMDFTAGNDLGQYLHRSKANPEVVFIIEAPAFGADQSEIYSVGYRLNDAYVEELYGKQYGKWRKESNPQLNNLMQIQITTDNVTINKSELPFGKDVSEWNKLLGAYSRNIDGDYVWDDLGIKLEKQQEVLRIYFLRDFGRDNPKLVFTDGLQIDNLILGGGIFPTEFNYKLKQENSVIIFNDNDGYLSYELPSKKISVELAGVYSGRPRGTKYVRIASVK